MVSKMFKTLLKKQLLELNAGFFQNNKTGTRRSKASSVALVVAFSLICVYLCVIFFLMANDMCKSLFEANFGWLYFAIMFGIGILLGVFGSVFNTYNSVYGAKDNNLLFSLPIPAKYILAVRILGVYIMGLLYTSVVTIPTIIAYFISGHATAAGVITSIISALLLSLIVMVISLLLGWLIAKITAKVKNKTFLTVLTSLVFIGLYLFVVSKANGFITAITTNSSFIASKMKIWGFPIYAIGQSCVGNLIYALGFLATTVLLCTLVFLLLWRSFFKLSLHSTSQQTSSRKTKFVQKNASSTLFAKEFKKLFSSANYLLNAASGSILTLLGMIVIITQKDNLSLLSELLGGDLCALMVLAAAVMLSSTNTISASSISLEGKNLWVVKSLPISPRKILHAKLNLHIAITLPFTLLTTIVASIIFKLSALQSVLVCLSSCVAVVGFALLGLLLNLNHANFNWVNETAVVKQSLPVFLSMFGGWAFVGVLAGLYFAFASIISATAYFYITCATILAITVIEFVLLETKGVKKFENLY